TFPMFIHSSIVANAGLGGRRVHGPEPANALSSSHETRRSPMQTLTLEIERLEERIAPWFVAPLPAGCEATQASQATHASQASKATHASQASQATHASQGLPCEQASEA